MGSDNIKSKEFHGIFEKLPLNETVQESLYRQTVRLSEVVDTRECEERMFAIDARTGELIVDNFEKTGPIDGSGFTSEEKRKIDLCKNYVIVMRDRPNNEPPAARDLLTYLHNDKIKISFILCRDGTLYGIYSVKKEFDELYNTYLKQAKERVSNIDAAKHIANTEVYRANEQLGKSDRLFDVRRFDVHERKN